MIKQIFRGDTLLASFVVALLSSFIIALAFLLVKTLSISAFDKKLFLDLTINILILFFLGGFVFFKGSAIAAWLLYRHDVTWGYKLEYGRVIPIMVIAFIMFIIVSSSIYLFVSSEIITLARLEQSIQLTELAS